MNAREVLEACCLALDAYDDGITLIGLAWAQGVIAKNRAAEHHGDCTKVAASCRRCAVDKASENATVVVAALAAAGFEVVPRRPRG